jgi:hypothetical protein
LIKFNQLFSDESNANGSLEFTIAGNPDDFFPVSVCFNPCGEMINKLVSRKRFDYEESFKSGVIFPAKILQRLLFLFVLGRVPFYKEVVHQCGGQQRRRGGFRRASQVLKRASLARRAL